MAMNQVKQASHTVGCRIPDELHAALKAAADERHMSMNYLVVKAIEDFLPRLIPADKLRLVQ